jgi:hypothetical protein
MNRAAGGLLALSTCIGAFGACSEPVSDDVAGPGVGGSKGGSSGAGGAWPDGSAATAGAGGTAGSGCIPDCTGKQCGDDGCGMPCPPGCSATETCEAGGCVPSVSCTPWKTAIAGVDPTEVVIDASTLLLSGSLAAEPWVGRLEACSGGGLQSAKIDLGGGKTGSASSLARAGASIYAVGNAMPGATDSGDGWFARLDPTSLAPAWTELASPSSTNDLLYDLVVAGSGGVWAVGEGAVGASSQAWVAKLSAGSGACSFLLGATGAKLWSVSADGSDVYVAGREGSAVVVHRFVDGACSPAPGCSCAPAASSPKISYPGASFTEARAILAMGGHVHLAGLADPGDGNFFAFVMRVDPGNGTVLGTFEWNPSTAVDGFLDLASDGTALYVGGGQNYDGSWANALPVLTALPFPLPANASAIWTLQPSSGKAASSIAVDTGADGGVYLALLDAIGASLSAVIMRCDKAGNCP